MIVFVTGASAGFGAEMARTFVKHGHQVVMAARRMDRLDALARELGESALPVEMDVASKESIDEALSMLPQSWRQIDVLINNAGLALNTLPAHQVPLADWETMIDTNCKGLVTMTHALLPAMVERGSGLIINLGSVAGAYPYPGGNVYGATKAFVEQFTLNLRADLVGTGVRATNLAPGLCGGTEFSNVRLKGDDAAAAKVYEGTTPLTAKDIADTCYWIATLPPHVNINLIEMMPTCQGFGPLNIRRA
ncbi:SDR family NAD(P)-dependent oxidoreductase [Massilia horti]|uniref:SDR family NAD(P)-dependent oxidoreductase n=1 Tax=Massilia horti TaxID=2562153 RepID=A0A4Y9SXW2_9BURK|nr:SDR family NAD(P)-dependent oxidoreductase [Massilia horti]TFW31270.1 SDR family NAD(P)-dependent oxidoreductase [Massilia horti]